MGKWITGVLGLVGSVLAVAKWIHVAIDGWGKIDFVNTHLSAQCLATGWGTAASVVGISLIGWAVYPWLRQWWQVDIGRQTAPEKSLEMSGTPSCQRRSRTPPPDNG